MSADARRFDPARRERVLALVEAGWSLEEACASAGISPRTVWRWLARGRVQQGSEAGEFTARLDAVRAVPRDADRRDDDEPDASEPWDAWRQVQAGDPFIALEPDRMAELSSQQQAEAERVSWAHGEQALAGKRQNGAAR